MRIYNAGLEALEKEAAYEPHRLKIARAATEKEVTAIKKAARKEKKNMNTLSIITKINFISYPIGMRRITD